MKKALFVLLPIMAVIFSCNNANNEVYVNTLEQEIEAIDLGLSVKWADRNVGASSPSDYGDYYAWGEIEPHYKPGYAQSKEVNIWKDGKTGYKLESYKWYQCSDTALYRPPVFKYAKSKYISDNMTDFKDYNYADDAARQNFGAKWRTPTTEEWTELIDNCKWTWTSQKGINGYIITGPNGRSIFLPAAGYRENLKIHLLGWYGRYWSSSIRPHTISSAYMAYFSDDSEGKMTSCDRYCGLSIRPVTDLPESESQTDRNFKKNILKPGVTYVTTSSTSDYDEYGGKVNLNMEFTIYNDGSVSGNIIETNSRSSYNNSNSYENHIRGTWKEVSIHDKRYLEIKFTLAGYYKDFKYYIDEQQKAYANDINTSPIALRKK